VIIALGEPHTRIWDVYSESVKPAETVTATESQYRHHEDIIDQLRPRVKQGIKTVLVATPNTDQYNSFMNHVKKHHGWLLKGYALNTVTIQHVKEPLNTIEEAKNLAASKQFRETLADASTMDLATVTGILEKRVNTAEGINTLRFSLTEVEDAVYGGGGVRVDYILVSERFSEQHRRRVQRLLQVAGNKGIKTRTVPGGTRLGARLSQFGGLIALLAD